jgi:hypothetical protein
LIQKKIQEGIKMEVEINKGYKDDLDLYVNGEYAARLFYDNGEFQMAHVYKCETSREEIHKILKDKFGKLNFVNDDRFGGSIAYPVKREKIISKIQNEHLGFSCNGKITQSRVTFSDGTEGIYVLDNGSPYRRDRVQIEEEDHKDFIGKPSSHLYEKGYKQI